MRANARFLPRLLYLTMALSAGTRVFGGDSDKIPKLRAMDQAQIREYVARPVSDGGEVWAAMLTRLAVYDVDISSLKDRGELAKLRTLQLSDTSITDASLVTIAQLPDLQELDLSYTEIGDASLKSLSGLTQLKRLNLCSTKITDAGLAPARVEAAPVIGPSEDAVTDKGLAQLRRLPLWKC